MIQFPYKEVFLPPGLISRCFCSLLADLIVKSCTDKCEHAIILFLGLRIEVFLFSAVFTQLKKRLVRWMKIAKNKVKRPTTLACVETKPLLTHIAQTVDDELSERCSKIWSKFIPQLVVLLMRTGFMPLFLLSTSFGRSN